MKNGSHCAMVIDTFLNQMHDYVVKVACGNLENSLLGIIGINIDLVIAIRSIHKRKLRCPTVVLTSMSLFSKENSSLGQVLLRSQKSIQHLLYPFFFFIGTIWASQLEYGVGFIKQHPKASEFPV